MADITTLWAGAGGDWSLASGDLQGGDDLETAALISIFTDRRAEPSDVIPDGSNDRRGWWGDLGAVYPIGSRLWLLGRAKQIPETLTAAETYCTEALQWMKDDGVVGGLAVTCSFIALGMLGIVVSFYRGDGSVLATYQWAWAGLSPQLAV